LEHLQYFHAHRSAFAYEPRRVSLVPPFVYEDEGMLTLQFQSCAVQSEMCVDDPDFLMLSYTRTMMGFLLFNSSPSRIAMIGLGGGSMPKWCYKELPQTDITVIEINPEVIAVRDVFQIPCDDHRFHVICGDGADYVANTLDAPEVLLVDGFDFEGQPPQLCSQRFYDDCYRTLDSNGVLVVNLCGQDDRLYIDRMRRSFQQRCLVVHPEDSTNKIVFATKGRHPWLSAQPLTELLNRIGRRARPKLYFVGGSHLD
jgi:spermidine synthase